jgi:hypothetical protein
MANLEPIEDKDLDLKNKFTQGLEAEKTQPEGGEKKYETGVPSVEKPVEARKEGAVEKEKAYSKILSRVRTIQPAQEEKVAADAESVNGEVSVENKIQKLVSLAVEKGVIHAVKVARHLEDNYTLDELHDRLLADELHQELVKKGLLKEL